MRPIIIGIGGAHSGSGKTTYASLLLRRLKGWGAIKYTKTGLYSSVVDDRETLSVGGKDTKRMLDAGAGRVLWVKSPPGELREVLPLAVEGLSDLKGIVVEGNSAIEFLRPNIIVFIFGSDPMKLKESAKGILEKADVIVSEEGTSPEGVEGAKRFQRSSSDTRKLLAYIMEAVEKAEKIRLSLRETSVEGKISCHLAKKIAEELSVPYREVGKVADEVSIKITDCELGCF